MSQDNARYFWCECNVWVQWNGNPVPGENGNTGWREGRINRFYTSLGVYGCACQAGVSVCISHLWTDRLRLAIHMLTIDLKVVTAMYSVYTNEAHCRDILWSSAMKQVDVFALYVCPSALYFPLRRDMRNFESGEMHVVQKLCVKLQTS